MSTGRDHSLIEELLSVDALDGLDADDRAVLDRERAAHGACEECDRLEKGFTELAWRLGSSLDPVPVRPGMAEDILRAAAAGGTDGRAAPSRGAPVVPQERRERKAGGGAWRGLAAVAAAAALFAGGWALRGLTTDGSVAAPAFARFGGDAPGTLAMAYRPGEPGVVLFGSDLPDPGPDHVYEIWMIQGTNAPVSGGCLTPKDGRILTYLDADLGDTDTMAVTVEPSSCPGAPTTDPVLTATIA